MPAITPTLWFGTQVRKIDIATAQKTYDQQ